MVVSIQIILTNKALSLITKCCKFPLPRKRVNITSVYVNIQWLTKRRPMSPVETFVHCLGFPQKLKNLNSQHHPNYNHSFTPYQPFGSNPICITVKSAIKTTQPTTRVTAQQSKKYQQNAIRIGTYITKSPRIHVRRFSQRADFEVT